MTALNRGVILGVMLCALLCATRALAAPERLGDWVPDATPDQAGAWSFSYNRLMLDLEGALTGERTAHDFYKLRYTFNPKTAVTLRYGRSDLAGGSGLLTPLFDGKDMATSFEVDLGMNLMYVPAVPADPANNVVFAAGSSFGIGVAGTRYQLDAGSLSEDDTMLKAYLIYSTDLSPELRAHTVFSSARLTGDSQSGSANRVGAGLDYALITGEHPLTLMANGIIDIYNFREPSFNTSRVSRFDVGLRYRVARSWYANLGWVTLNDSESDKSGSGLFAGINFVAEPPPPAPPCPEPPPAAPPAEAPPADAAPAAPPTAMQPSGELVAQLPEQPPLMDVAPAASGSKQAASASIEGFRADFLGDLDKPVLQAAVPADLEEAPVPPADTDSTQLKPVDPAAVFPEPASTETPALAPVEAQPADAADDGVAIPMFPLDPPQPTPVGAVMVRAGRPLRLAAAATAAKLDAVTRPPAGPYTAEDPVAPPMDAESAGELAASPEELAETAGTGLIAINQPGAVSGHTTAPEPDDQPSGDQPETDDASGSAS